MAPRLGTEELADALGRRLGGTVRGLRRLSGGASRVTSVFELEEAGSGPRRMILQMDRGDGAQGGKVRMERALLEAAGAAGVPVPGVLAASTPPSGDDVGLPDGLGLAVEVGWTEPVGLGVVVGDGVGLPEPPPHPSTRMKPEARVARSR